MNDVEADAMDIDEWWGHIERARVAAGDQADDRDSPDDPLVDILMEMLVALPPDQIIAFGRRFSEVWHSAHQWRLWAAAYLIEGGCGDDGFMDFRAGLILLGRTTFTRAVDDPDSLADLPVVIRMAGGDGGWIGCEDMNYAAHIAYERVQGEYDEGLSTPAWPDRAAGERWDLEDDDEMRKRLPRLSELFL